MLTDAAHPERKPAARRRILVQPLFEHGQGSTGFTVGAWSAMLASRNARPYRESSVMSLAKSACFVSAIDGS
jgi:hypothetical protein